ncbi:MAG TPA: hypothetical protein VD706_03280 [Candidatus Saccharimonadales bacterium]|nr:hypothetical protein [Candidatus Saccharimonadales bacterium]
MAFQRIRSRLHSKKLLALVLVLVVAGVVAGLELSDTTHMFHDSKAVSGKIPVKETSETKPSAKTSQQKTASSENTAANTAATSAKNTAGGGSQSSAQTSAPLKAPFGSFVSSHSASLNGASGQQSTCITTPGATCTITFTNGGVVKELPAKTTDGNGNATWEWDVKAAGFSEGNWTIKATATLNGQSQSVTDPKALRVQS